MARIYISSVIGTSVGAVWERVRDFNGLPAWHPLIGESRIENGEPPDRVGCVRVLTLQDGSTVREQLLGLSDFDLFCTYSILESSMGVEGYVATWRYAGDRRRPDIRRVVGGVRLRPRGGGQLSRGSAPTCSGVATPETTPAAEAPEGGRRGEG